MDSLEYHKVLSQEFWHFMLKIRIVFKFKLCLHSLVRWVNASQQPSTHTAFHSLPRPSRMGERIRKTKVRKFISWDKYNLIDEGKRGKNPPQAIEKKSLSTSHKSTDAQPFAKQQPHWEAIPHPFLHASSCCWTLCYMVWNIPLANLGQLSQLVFPCQLLAMPCWG